MPTQQAMGSTGERLNLDKFFEAQRFPFVDKIERVDKLCLGCGVQKRACMCGAITAIHANCYELRIERKMDYIIELLERGGSEE